ncbi:MAG: alanine/glycine:cation symporter family protein [Alphaproteobacteria bacterium]
MTISDVRDFIVWGPLMLVLLLGTGIYLTIGLKFMPIRRLGAGFRLAARGRKPRPGEEGEITPFQALATALSATIGTGNIAGVATAIVLGGPGAVFWMWITALVGMATKYAEAVLAVKYRETDEHGHYVGGPMYYIKNGLGRQWRWLAVAFALFASVAAFGIGNMVQANSVALALQEHSNLDLPAWVTGLVLSGLAFMVIIGGIRRIGQVAEYLVPFMAASYFLGAAIIIVLNAGEVPGLLAMIVENAFTGTAATGGFAGATVWAALRFGVARGIFSNEAGLGSAAIAHAAAKTRDPVRQGTIAMTGTFIDTLIVCTMTALVILLVQIPWGTEGEGILKPAWASGLDGAALTVFAFSEGLPGGGWVVTMGLCVFAFTTILGWAYYGERAIGFLLPMRKVGVRLPNMMLAVVPALKPKANERGEVVVPMVLIYRLVWVVMIFVGAVGGLRFVWAFADVMNALMAFPNLVALLLLSGTVFAVTRTTLQKDKSSEAKADDRIQEA